jgi:hypothetical protein
MNGIELIAAERQRQIEKEGWTPAHDDQWIFGEMCDVAALYAVEDKFIYDSDGEKIDLVYHMYPRSRWDWKWWKPTPGFI